MAVLEAQWPSRNLVGSLFALTAFQSILSVGDIMRALAGVLLTGLTGMSPLSFAAHSSET